MFYLIINLDIGFYLENLLAVAKRYLMTNQRMLLSIKIIVIVFYHTSH